MTAASASSAATYLTAGIFAPFNISSGAETLTAHYTIFLVRRLVPASGLRTYSVRGSKSGTANPSVGAGAGGIGNHVPGFIRITKVT